MSVFTWEVRRYRNRSSNLGKCMVLKVKVIPVVILVALVANSSWLFIIPVSLLDCGAG